MLGREVDRSLVKRGADPISCADDLENTMYAGCRTLALQVVALVVLLASPIAARAQTTVEDLADAVVHIQTHINPDGRTVQNLGLERQGSGIVIGSDGLILTIGYLMVESHAAEVTTNAGHTVPADVVGYDHESGFGLIKATQSLGLRPLGLGKSADLKADDPVLAVSFGG